MIILVGDGLDFVMRQGLVDVFHRAVVRVVNDVGVEIFHESTSDRSLWVVANVAAARVFSFSQSGLTPTYDMNLAHEYRPLLYIYLSH